MKEQDDKFGVLIKEELRKDAKQIEDAIRSDPEIANMKASPQLQKKIYDKIHAYEQEHLVEKKK